MINLSFPSKKLKEYIKRVNLKVKDTEYKQENLIVYGVTNKAGITVTGNQASDDLNNYYVLKENQFAYNPYRINVGSLGLAPIGLLGVVSPAYVVFETTSEYNNEFLYMYLKSALGINLIKWYGDRGGVRSALRYNDLEQIDIPNLILEQQLALLEKLKVYNQYLDKLTTNLDIQNSLISSLRQSILNEAVQGKLVSQTDKNTNIEKCDIECDLETFHIPMGWTIASINQLLLTKNGMRTGPFGTMLSKSDQMFGGVPVWGIESISKNGRFTKQNKIFISYEKAKELEPFSVKGGDIIISRSGTVGELCVLPPNVEKGIISTNLMKITLNKDIINPYFFCFLFKGSQLILNKLIDLCSGSTRLFLTQKILNSLDFPLPPLNEQERVVEKVDQLMGLCDELEETVEQSIQESVLLMQSILQEAFQQT